MRLDVALVKKGNYPTRTKAATAILAGLVCVNGIVAQKSSQSVDLTDNISTLPLPYVSGRGSLKLIHALKEFNVNPIGYTCLDVGASTGGFTEALLNAGAAKVIAVDVGTNQLIPELRNDPRVQSVEQTDIRNLRPALPADLIVVDVSFISLSDIVESLATWGAPQIITLIKPQFEVARSIAAKSDGIIKSDADRQYAIDKTVKSFAVFGFKCCGITKSPITGGSGNIEYLALFVK